MCAKYASLKDRILAAEASIRGLDAVKDKYLPLEQDGVIYNLYNLPDGFVIKGNVDLMFKGLTKLPDLSKVIVKGYFNCSGNQLTSLKGAPQKVGGNFNCSYNQLTSLKGVPQKIEGSFNCSENQLTSLEGAPQKVGGNFRCYGNQLTSLKGAPQKVGGNFWCYGNQLTSLFGISQMKDKNNIYSDQEVCGKYDLSASGFTYAELLNTSRYKSEAAQRRISAAQHQTEDVTPKKKETTVRRDSDTQTEIARAKFQEWLKNKESEKK